MMSAYLTEVSNHDKLDIKFVRVLATLYGGVNLLVLITKDALPKQWITSTKKIGFLFEILQMLLERMLFCRKGGQIGV